MVKCRCRAGWTRKTAAKSKISRSFLFSVCVFMYVYVCVCTFSKEVKPVPVRGDLFLGDLYMNYMKVFHFISG